MGNIILGLIPALMWGMLPVILQKLGGKPGSQQMGLALGALLFAVVVLFFKGPVDWTPNIVISSFICGLVWTLAMNTQIVSYSLLGVAVTMPFTAGLQIIGTTLIGVLYFGEWTTTGKIVLGFAAILLIIIGVVFTTYSEKKNTAAGSAPANNKRSGIIVLVISSIAFIVWATIPRFTHVNGWDANFPLAVGMFVGTFVYGLIRNEGQMWAASSFRNILSGIVFSAGSLAMMLSNEINGIAVGFTLAQMLIVVSTLGGLLILKEQKSRKEISFILLGVCMVVCGGIGIGMTKL